MSSEPKMTLATARLKQARDFILANPTLTKSQIILQTGLSDSTIARARRDLIEEGLLPASRNAPSPAPVSTPAPKQEPAAVQDAPKPPSPKAKSAGTLMDHDALVALADLVDRAVEAGDDASVQKMLLKQSLTFALRTDLHPDTRMSASTLWGKLKDWAREKDLGPGIPKTHEMKVERLCSLMVACGIEVLTDAAKKAIDILTRESSDAGIVSTDASKAPSNAAGASESPGSASGVQAPAGVQGSGGMELGTASN